MQKVSALKREKYHACDLCMEAKERSFAPCKFCPSHASTVHPAAQLTARDMLFQLHVTIIDAGTRLYLKGQVVGVAVVNGIVNVLDTDDRDDRAEWLLPCNSHVLQHSIQHQQAAAVTHVLELLQTCVRVRLVQR